jgi:hypothetical protein
MNGFLTLEQLLRLFQQYNLAIWPMQVLAYGLAALALFLALKRTTQSDRIIGGILDRRGTRPLTSKRPT